MKSIHDILDLGTGFHRIPNVRLRLIDTPDNRIEIHEINEYYSSIWGNRKIEFGEIYESLSIQVGPYSSEIKIKEFSDTSLNSIMFEVIEIMIDSEWVKIYFSGKNDYDL